MPDHLLTTTASNEAPKLNIASNPVARDLECHFSISESFFPTWMVSSHRAVVLLDR